MLRRIMVLFSFVALAFVALPPRGVCLREMLTHAGCCDPSTARVAAASGQVKSCCAACAKAARHEKPVDDAPLGHSGSELCYMASGDLYVSPGKSITADVQDVVGIDLLSIRELALLPELPTNHVARTFVASAMELFSCTAPGKLFLRI